MYFPSCPTASPEVKKSSTGSPTNLPCEVKVISSVFCDQVYVEAWVVSIDFLTRILKASPFEAGAEIVDVLLLAILLVTVVLVVLL